MRRTTIDLATSRLRAHRGGLALAVAVCAASLLLAGAPEARTVGLLTKQAGFQPGYSLFSTLTYPEVFLIDHNGRLVHSWPTTFVSGNTNYLLSNGDLLRSVDPGGNTTFVAGGDAGMVQRRAWDGTVLWEFTYSDTSVRHHHDIAPMPNGNVLLIAWELKTGAQAAAAGRDPASMATGELWPEHIVEVEPVGATGGNIVWEWHLWDHLIQDFDPLKDNFGVVADHPELVDVNYHLNTDADWLHMNSIDYNPELDQIVLGAVWNHEFWIIDHGTTTAEAAGHTGGARGKGGDLLYRWGNPAAYGRGAPADQTLFRPHDAHWIPPGLNGAGNILVLNNRNPGGFTSVEEIVTPVDANGDYPVLAPGVPHGPASSFWTWTDTPATNFFTGGLGGAQRQPNGNTLVCGGATGRAMEVDATSEEIIWEYVNPVGSAGPVDQGETTTSNRFFRFTRYPSDFSGFVGKNTTPGFVIEGPVAVPLLPADFAGALLVCCLLGGAGWLRLRFAAR